jgi:hypothetical protein
VIRVMKLRVENGEETEARTEVRETMTEMITMVMNEIQKMDAERARHLCGQDGSSMRVVRGVLSVMLLREKHQKIPAKAAKSRAMGHSSDSAIEQTRNVVGPC